MGIKHTELVAQLLDNLNHPKKKENYIPLILGVIIGIICGSIPIGVMMIG